MIMDVKARGVTRRMSRLVRWLTGRNALRRPVDRIEGAVLVALSTALLVALAMAAVLGTHAYQSQRAASASLYPAVAVLIQAGPFYGNVTHIGQAEARWRDRWGGKRSGVLTTVSAPGILGAAAGARIPVLLDRSGQPVAPPGSRVAIHRRHHAFADRPGDPHSPYRYGTSAAGQLRGLAHAHMGWLLRDDQASSA